MALADQIVDVDRDILDLALGKNAVADVSARSVQNVGEVGWAGVHGSLLLQHFP